MPWPQTGLIIHFFIGTALDITWTLNLNKLKRYLLGFMKLSITEILLNYLYFQYFIVSIFQLVQVERHLLVNYIYTLPKADLSNESRVKMIVDEVKMIIL